MESARFSIARPVPMRSRRALWLRILNPSILLLFGSTLANAQQPSPLPQPCLARAETPSELSTLLNAVQRSPSGAAYLNLGKFYLEADRLACAISTLEQSLKTGPQSWKAHYYLAQASLRAGDQERAESEMETAHSQGGNAMLDVLDADRVRAASIARLHEAANQALAAGNAAAAADGYRKALQINPRDPKLRYNLAVALGDQGDFPAEDIELKKAVAIDPNLAAAQNKLGALAMQKQQPTEAESRFKKALAIDSSFAEAQDNLGALYAQQGKNSEADALFLQAIANDPKNANALADLGMLRLKIGNDDHALSNLQKAVSLEPESASLRVDLGVGLEHQANRPEAFREFSEAVRLDQDLAAAHYNLGRMLFEDGKYPEADKELRTAVRLQPNYASALYYLAVTAHQQDQEDRSTELLKKVIALRPDNADAQYLLGQNLEHAGDVRGAVEHWKAAIQVDPNYSAALHNLARALTKLHDPGAKIYQDRFDAQLRNQQITDRATALGNVALEAAKVKDWPRTIKQMNEAIEICGDCSLSAHLHKNLALFYVQMGNVGEARKALNEALQLAPQDKEIESAIASLPPSQ